MERREAKVDRYAVRSIRNTRHRFQYQRGLARVVRGEKRQLKRTVQPSFRVLFMERRRLRAGG